MKGKYIGVVSLDKNIYALNDIVLVTVVDPDLNLDPTTIDIAKVTARSTSDPKGIILVLRETRQDTGIFCGSFRLDPLSSSSDRLKVKPGDTIEVIYRDETTPDGIPRDIIVTALVVAEKPWVSGPKELLQHGLEHLLQDTDFDRRIALISIDNAVELMIKTYLSLPSRITGFKISRTEYERISESFPSLLEALEQYASDKLAGIDIADLEWYHRIRNTIYHQGSGITIERQKIENYADIAKTLFQNLFETPVGIPETRPTLVGEFINKWATLEREVYTIAKLYGISEEKIHQPLQKILYMLESLGIISKDIIRQINEFRIFRNRLVHGLETYTAEEVRFYLDELERLLKKLSRV